MLSRLRSEFSRKGLARPNLNRAAIALVLSTAGLVQAQTSTPGTAPKSAPGDALKGPAVIDRHAPDTNNTFGKGGAGGNEFKKNLGDRTPPQAYMHAIRSLEAPEAPADVRPTDEQRQRLQAIATEQREAMRAFMEKNKDQLKALRDQARASRGQGGKGRPEGGRPERGGAPDGEMPPPPTGENAERFREIMKDGPKPKEAFDKAWQILTPAQQKYVQTQLDQAKERGAEGRKQDYVDRKARKNGAGADGGRPGSETGDQPAKPRKNRPGNRPANGAEPPVQPTND